MNFIVQINLFTMLPESCLGYKPVAILQIQVKLWAIFIKNFFFFFVKCASHLAIFVCNTMREWAFLYVGIKFQASSGYSEIIMPYLGR